MRVCLVCRTPNLPANPVCVNCNYQFFASRESKLRAVDETVLPQAPPRRAPDPEAFSPVEFDADDVAALPQAPPAQPRAAGPLGAPPAPAKRSAPKRSSFPRVPKEVAEPDKEPLRYDAMRKALILVVTLIVVGYAVPFAIGALHIDLGGIGITGIISYILILLFWSYARGVGRATSRPLSAVEQEALGKVKAGGGLLLVIPLFGSILSQFGIYFQTNPMSPIYYALAGIGIYYTLAGVTSLKERYSYYAVFQFGFTLLLLQPLPAVLPGPVATAIFSSVYWYQTTILFLSVGFIIIALALRKMRAGQYDALEQSLAAGKKALEGRQYDKAIPHFDRAVTIAHSLYSEKLFKSTRSGQRVLPADYYEPWVGKATALALSGKGGKALTILDIILEVDGTNADLWVNKGEILLSLNRPAEAYIAFEAAQRLSPSHPVVMGAKTRALDRLKHRIE